MSGRKLQDLELTTRKRAPTRGEEKMAGNQKTTYIYEQFSEEDLSISVELAVETTPHYGMMQKAAIKTAEEMLVIVRENWERIAINYGFSRGAAE